MLATPIAKANPLQQVPGERNGEYAIILRVYWQDFIFVLYCSIHEYAICTENDSEIADESSIASDMTWHPQPQCYHYVRFNCVSKKTAREETWVQYRQNMAALTDRFTKSNAMWVS